MEPIMTTLAIFFKKNLIESLLFLVGFVFFRAVLEEMAMSEGVVGSVGRILYAGVAGLYAGALVAIASYMVAPNYEILPVLGFLIGGALGLKYIRHIIKQKVEEKINKI